jgi:hypothetical protein
MVAKAKKIEWWSFVGMSISGQLFPPTYFGRAPPPFLMSSKEDPRLGFATQATKQSSRNLVQHQVHDVIASPSTENDTQDAFGVICSTKVA